MNWRQLLYDLTRDSFEGILILAVLALILFAIAISMFERRSIKKRKVLYNGAENSRADASGRGDIPAGLNVVAEESVLPQKMIDAGAVWSDELTNLAAGEGLDSVFAVLPVFSSLSFQVRQGYARLAQREMWTRLYVSRLSLAKYDVETGLWLWGLDPDESVLPVLVDMLGGKDDDVRMSAVMFLTRLKDKRAIPYLIGALMQPQRYVVARVVEVLSGFGNTAAITLSRLLPELSDQAQLTVLESLSVFPSTYPMSPVIDCLAAPREQVRMLAARTLGDSDCKEAIPALYAALDDSSWQVRAAAVKALGQLDAIECYDRIKAMESDEAWHVRVNCREATGRLESLLSAEKTD